MNQVLIFFLIFGLSNLQLAVAKSAEPQCDNSDRGLSSLGCAIKDGKLTGLRCVGGDPKFHPQGVGHLEIHNTVGAHQMSNRLTRHLEFNGGYFEESFAEDSMLETNYEINFENRLGTMVLQNSPMDSDCTLDELGELYIGEILLGVKFALISTLRFQEQADAIRFDEKHDVSALWGALGKFGTIDPKMEALLKNVQVSVRAVQRGGNLTALKSLEESTEVVSCTNERNLDSCFAAFRRYNEYLQNDLPRQLIIPSDPERLKEFAKSLFPLNFVVEHYSKAWKS